MCGTTSTTSSPSTRRTMRNTPWVAGCCGPMLMLRSIVSSSCSIGTASRSTAMSDLVAPGWRRALAEDRPAGRLRPSPRPCSLLVLDRRYVVTGAGGYVAGLGHVRAQLLALPLLERRQRVLLAQREVVEHVFGQEDG